MCMYIYIYSIYMPVWNAQTFLSAKMEIFQITGSPAVHMRGKFGELHKLRV